jgi:nuclear GTP-binding protein
VSEHHRKSRKLAKQSTQWRSKKPKDLGIPNAFPFKEQILAEREEVRRRRQEEKENKRKGMVDGMTMVAQQIGNNGIERKEASGFVAGLQVDSEDEEVLEDEIDSNEEEESDDDDDGEDYEIDGDDDEDEEMDVESSDSEWEGIESEEETSEIETLTEINTIRNSTKPPFIQAINRSDLVIFVLDARAPDSTRSFDLEQYAEKKGKSCIFVLNRAGISKFQLN